MILVGIGVSRPACCENTRLRAKRAHLTKQSKSSRNYATPIFQPTGDSFIFQLRTILIFRVVSVDTLGATPLGLTG
jgi:hypothetical protein